MLLDSQSDRSHRPAALGEPLTVRERRAKGRMGDHASRALMVYLDTNACDHIEQQLGVIETDRAILERAAKSRKIEVPFSVFSREVVLPLTGSISDLGLREIELGLTRKD
jgi:hypothetical protein